ncbi:hypothetical protein SAMD00023353_0303230 [Rosellinia necatrix]|uniref:Uncharacterized protein n=1 Tax=Rosellinia necatrix TaxID=77044 RepID=A0A1S8A566_ROSNE|nr:hypothetical protein SAMD00023353_0303230 [Rosellinia necatrix]
MMTEEIETGIATAAIMAVTKGVVAAPEAPTIVDIANEIGIEIGIGTIAVASAL